MRDGDCPESFRNAVTHLFEEFPGPYSIMGEPPTIVPATTEAEREAIAGALASIQQSQQTGAKEHLTKSSQALSEGDYPGSIREAVHAVESAASRIVGKKATLADALKMLEKNQGLHPALKQGFEKLYAYANDKEGIRHANFDLKTEDISEAEALFMFGACASFVAYLDRKFFAA